MGTCVSGGQARNASGYWPGALLLLASLTLAGCGGGGGKSNETPVANDAAVSTPEDTALEITLTASDGDGDALTFSIVTAPTHGVLGTVTAGSGTSARVTYTPNTGYSGADSFSFKAADGDGAEDSATVSITVTPVNDPPVADAGNAATDEDVAVTVTLTGSDPDGDALTFSIGTPPAAGTLGAVTPVSATGAQVTYTPNADTSGTDGFVFQVDDGQGGTATAAVSITVSAVNDPPVANAGNVATDEDVAVTVTLTGSDPDGDALTFSIGTPPAAGTLGALTPVSATSAQVTYTPNADTSGTDRFVFQVDDGQGATATAAVDVTVAAAPDPVRAGDDAVSTDEDSTVAFAVLGNDSDPDGDTIAWASTDPTGLLGDLTDNGDGSYVYDPNGQFESLAVGASATETFTYTVDSADGSSATATVRITVNGVNDPPAADPQTLATDEDVPLTITLTGIDPDGDSLTFSVPVVPPGGALGTITPLSPVSAQVTYTPNGDFNGIDGFDFVADDGRGGTATARVDIRVDPLPDPARAVDDVVGTDEDTPVGFRVLDNDLDPDAGDTVSFASTDAAGLVGALTDNGDGTYVFDPAGAYEDLAVGEARITTFGYTIDSSDGSSDSATVTITVTGVNDAPAPVGDRFGETNLLLNGDFDDRDPGDLGGWTTDAGGGGNFFADNDTTTPASGAATTGPATGWYAVSDMNNPSVMVLRQSFAVPEDAVSVVAAFDIYVDNRADAVVNPAGLDVVFPNQHARVDLLSAAATAFDTTAGVLANLFIVPDGQPAVTQPPPYEPYAFDVTGQAAGGGTYQLRFGVVVTEFFMYLGVDNVRVAAGTDRETPIGVPAPGVLGNDDDPDGDVLSVTAFDSLSAEGATVTVNPDGSYTYDPSASLTLAALERGETVVDTFTYTAGDGNGGTQTATVEIVVNGVSNSPPVADAQSVTTPEDTALEIVLGGSDPDLNPLSFSILTSPASGTLGPVTPIDATSARVTYTPDPDANGLDSFEFEVDDGRGASAAATVTVDVSAENDAPTALNLDSTTVNENEPDATLVGTFSSNDIDSVAFTYTLVAGAGDTGNGSFTIAGDNLRTAGSFDFEDQASYSIRVQTDDGAGGQFEQSFVIEVLDVNDPPLALGETFSTAIGNTLLAVGVAVAGEPVVSLAGSVLANDSDPDGPAPLVVSSTGTLASANGGTVEMNADGSFTYLPPVGFTGTGVAADTFAYTVFDGAAGSNATASVEVVELVWYFDDSAAGGGDGRSRAPLTDLPGAAGIGGPGDTLFVYAGTQSVGVTLRDGQQLLGEGVGLSVNALGLVAPGARPSIANPGGFAVTLARDNTVRGLDINSQAGISGANAGVVTVNGASITATNGPAVDIVDSDNVAMTLDNLNATNSAANGNGVSLIDNGGGSVRVTGTTRVIAPNGWALRVVAAGSLGSVYDFGATTLNARRGLLLADNPGADFSFASLDIDASLGAGLSAANNGTLTVDGVANTIDVADADTGPGVLIAETFLGDPGSGAMTFLRISSAGGTGGIALDTTGNLARFVITGTGTVAGSGGVIANTGGDGINLNAVDGGVSFANLTVRGNLDSGIRGTIVTGFVLIDSVIEDNTNLTPVDEAGILFDNLTGSADITRTRISGSTRDNVTIRNTTGNLALTVAGGRIEDNSSANGNHGLFVQGSGDTEIDATLDGVVFGGNRGDDLRANALGAAALDINVFGGSMTGAAGKLGSGITLTGDADLTFDIDRVAITGAGTSAINVSQASAAQAGDVFDGSVTNNLIGTAVADSGSRTGSGVRAIANGNGTLTITIAGNTIRQYNDNGIEVIGRDGNGVNKVLNATIIGNTVTDPAAFAADGVQVQAGATATDAGTVCAVIGGTAAADQNDLVDAGGAFDDDFRIRQRFGTTLRLPGYAGASNDTAAVIAFVQGNNNNAGLPSGSATEATGAGGGGFVGTGATCP